MSITSTVDKTAPVLITGLPQTIPTGFAFAAASDLLVLDSGAAGTGRDPATILVLGSDYTVTGGGYNAANQMQSGSVVVNSGGAGLVLVNDFIVVLRAAPLNQTSSFTSTGPLTVQLIEQALDKNATLAQQVNEIAGRSLQFEKQETLSTTLILASRKNNVLGFDANGNLAYYVLTGTTVALQSLTGTAGQVLVNGGVGPVTGNVTLTLAGGSPSLTGTANQVLVNGGVGPVAGGAVTLTTPQSIGTASSVQFGRFAIGTAPLTTSDLVVTHSLPPSATQPCVSIQGSFSAPGATLLFPNAVRDSTVFTASTATDAYASYDANAQLLGTVALNHFYGFQARQYYGGSNTLDVMSGYNVSLTIAAGVISEMRGYYVPNQTVSGGTVTHFAGLYMDQLSVGTTRHAIYLAGTDDVFMGGGQISTSALLAPVVTTSRLDVTFDQGTQIGAAIKNKNVTNTGTFINFYNSSTVVQGSIAQTNSTVTAYNTTSDLRLKTNVRDMADSGLILDALRPVVFDWKWGGKDSHGFIAQDTFKVFPEAVTPGDTPGDTPGEEIVHVWQMDFAKMVPVLAAEVKSLRARVAVLEHCLLEH